MDPNNEAGEPDTRYSLLSEAFQSDYANTPPAGSGANTSLSTANPTPSNPPTLYPPDPLCSSSSLHLSESTHMLSVADAPRSVPTLTNLTLRYLAAHLANNTYHFKRFDFLPPTLLQLLFDAVAVYWLEPSGPRWTKDHTIRLLQLFCEPGIKSLHLGRIKGHDYVLNALTSTIAERGGTFTGLRFLEIRVTRQTSTSSLRKLLLTTPYLEVLRFVVLDDVISTRPFGDVDVIALLPHLKHLELDFEGNVAAGSRRRSAVPAAATNALPLDLVRHEGCQQLCWVNLRGRALLQPPVIRTLCLRAPLLEHLFLDDTEVTDHVVSSVIRHCRHLCTLSVSDCRRLSDHAFEDLARGFLENILHLSLAGVKNLTEATLSFIAEGCPSLVLLDLRFCDPSLFESPSLADVVESCRDLETVLVCFNDAKGLGRLEAGEAIDNDGDDRELEDSQYSLFSGGKFQALRAFWDADSQNTRREYVTLGASKLKPTSSVPMDQSESRIPPPASDLPKPVLPKSAEGLWPVSFWTRL